MDARERELVTPLTRNNFASADIKRMIQHPHYYSERGEEAAAKNMATRDALELRCPFCVPAFSSLPPQVDTSDGFGIFCSGWIVSL